MKYLCPLGYSKYCNKECLNSNTKDPQQQRVYCFEEYLHDDLLIEDDTLTLEECQKIADKICVRYGIWSPTVEDGRGCKTASGCPEVIQLPHKYREYISIVHETCHALTGYYDRLHPPHGPIFVRFFINHLPQFVSVSVGYLLKVAKDFKLEVAPKKLCLPPPYYKVQKLCDMHRDLLRAELMMKKLEKNYTVTKRKLENKRNKYQKYIEKLHDKLWPE